jgi:hypothetical protein
MARASLVCLVVMLGFLAAAASGGGATRTFNGWLQGVSGRTHDVYEGDRFQLVFSSRRTVHYRLCVVRRGGYFNGCWTRSAVVGQPSRLDMTLKFIDAPGGWEAPFGKYVATWSVAGRHVALWRFAWHPAG